MLVHRAHVLLAVCSTAGKGFAPNVQRLFPLHSAVMLGGTGLSIIGGLNSGGCPLFSGADQCMCRNMFLSVLSGSIDRREPGPTLQFKGVK